MKTKTSFINAAVAVGALFFALIPQGVAATYYVDYASGSDSKAGTSKDTAWKRHPYMNGWTGSYTHTDGDRFIFKGGVTWPNAALSFYITRGGSVTSPDTYTVDQTWFSGASWTRPILDANGESVPDRLPSFIGRECPVVITGSNVKFDNFEVRRWKTTAYDGNGVKGSGIVGYGGTGIEITKCYLHDWIFAVGTKQDNGSGIVSYQANVTARNCKVTGPQQPIDPLFKTSATGTTVGSAYHSLAEVDHCEATGTTDGTHMCFRVHHTVIHDTGHSVDATAHGNGFWIKAKNAKFYSNIVTGSHDIVGYIEPTGFSTSVSNSTILFYNNVIYANAGPQIAVDWEMANSPNAATTGVWFFNNTLVDAMIRIGVKTTSTYGFYKLQNNLYIKNTAPVEVITHPYAAAVDDHNVTLNSADALSLGLLRSNNYRLLNRVRGVSGVGANLTTMCADGFGLLDFDGKARPDPDGWSAGAFEYGTRPSPPSNLRAIETP